MINVRIQSKEQPRLAPKISVVGVGGGGGNAINNMISAHMEGVSFIVCNTDAQALQNALADNKIQLGTGVTSGLGAGARPEMGRASAEESIDEVMSFLEDSNMVFITAGMGGGTGTGAAPVIAKACRERGILTVGVVTKPFHFEGTMRMKMAEQGISEMQQYVDTLIVVPNQNLFRVANERTTFAEAFRIADSVLMAGVRGVTDVMVVPGLVNLDFADVRSAMQQMGKAMMGTGEASGDRRAIEAADKAINNPLLDDVSMKGARSVIINVTGGYDLTMFEVDEACNRIRDEVDPNANIFFGATFDEAMEGSIRVTVIATGIDVEADRKTKGGQGGGYVATATSQTALMANEGERRNAGTTYATRPASEPASQQSTTAAPQASAALNRQVPTAAQQARQAAAATVAATSSRRQEEPESDLFEQEEFVHQPRHAQPAAQGQQASSSMRGTRYNDSFIPPLPMEPDMMDRQQAYATAGGYGYQPQQPQYQQQADQVSRPVMQQQRQHMDYAPQPQQAVAQQTVAPQTTTAPLSYGMASSHQHAPRKRTPSLFERIKGQMWGGDDSSRDVMAEAPELAPQPQQAPVAETRAPAQQQQPQQRNAAPARQGMLDISSPSRPGKEEDELDIPAFLRRQAN